MTPLICKVVLGAVVPVDAGGIVVSTFQVVLAPIFLGVGFNTLAPSFCKAGKREREQVIKHLKFRLNDLDIPTVDEWIIFMSFSYPKYLQPFPVWQHVFTLATLVKIMEGCDALHTGGGGDFHRTLGGCLGGEMR